MEESRKIGEFSQYIKELYSVQSIKLFELIEKMEEEAFSESGPLFKFRKTDLLAKLIEYFESIEEYEKCSDLLKIKKKIYPE
jgi:hypothetical protein